MYTNGQDEVVREGVIEEWNDKKRRVNVRTTLKGSPWKGEPGSLPVLTLGHSDESTNEPYA